MSHTPSCRVRVTTLDTMLIRGASLWLAGLLGTACVGAVGSSDVEIQGEPSGPGNGAQPSQKPPPATTTMPTTTAPTPIVPPPSVVECQVGVPAAWPMRRLTREEYDNSIARLLPGVKLRPASSFGPDERDVAGFSVNSQDSVPGELAGDYFFAAEALAAEAVTNLAALHPCSTQTEGETACARKFAETFGSRAYRRPLHMDERDRMMRVFSAVRPGADYAQGIQAILQVILQSPKFLYRAEAAEARASASDPVLRNHAIAANVSYWLTANMPDTELLAAASARQLDNTEQLRAHIKRLMGTSPARDRFTSIMTAWMGLEGLEQASKVNKAFTPSVAASLMDETRASVRELLRADAGFARLMTSSQTVLPKPALATYYGLDAATPVGRLVEFPQRSGLLTQGSFIAMHSAGDHTSYVRLGRKVWEAVLCQVMPDPPPTIDPVLPPTDQSIKTTRQQFEAVDKTAACSGCHLIMDRIGFGFAAFDEIGRPRTQENGVRIDASGVVSGPGDAHGTFADARGLASLLASSQVARTCFARQWFRAAAGRDALGADACLVDRTKQAASARPDGDLGVPEIVEALALEAASQPKGAVE